MPHGIVCQAIKNPDGADQRGFLTLGSSYLASLSSLAAAITSVAIFCGQGR